MEISLRYPSPYLRELGKNYKRLGQQARLGIEPSNSSLPALKAESYKYLHLRCDIRRTLYPM